MISLKTFKGEAPRVARRALPDNMSTSAVNARLLSGNLEAWKDISSIFLLGKPGPTNTAYAFYDGTDVIKWFSWAQSELQNGATQVDVARIPIANDTAYRVVFTGTGKPQITDVELALGGNTAPNGPYPIDSDDLAVLAPDAAPTVVNIPGTAANNVTTTTYTTDSSTWNVAHGGAFGSVATISTSTKAVIPTPCFDFIGQQVSHTTANILGDFGQSTALGFVFECNAGSTNSGDLVEAQTAYAQIMSDGNGIGAIGAQLTLKYTNPNRTDITWQDQGSGAAETVIGTLPTVETGVHIKIAAHSPAKNASGVTTFMCDVTVTNVSGGALICASTNLLATFCGDAVTLSSVGGENAPSEGHVYFGNISMVVTSAPTTFIAVFSNYLYTRANNLLLESGPSPASTPSVQVDNGNINIVTIPQPPGGEEDAEFYLYRVATGSSGSQYQQVENGNFSDGGFPLAIDSGTANALVLTTLDGAAPVGDTSYFFVATSTSLAGAVSAALNGNPADPVFLPDGSAVPAGGITSGNPYTLVYNRKVILSASNQVASGIAVIPVNDTTGIQNGQVVTDEVGAILPGTTVSSFVANTSVTLSQPLSIAVNAGNLFFFDVTTDTYTLLAGFTYRDATPTADLGGPLVSTDWDPPPDNMLGIIALPNEVLAGFVGNTLCLSVPGQPQAWPLSYQLATDNPIVALVALGFNIGILTTGRPYTAYGTDPSAMQMGIESFPQGCESARSTAYSRLYGALYASTDGVYAYAGFGQIKNLTDQIFTKREWALLNPSSIIGAVHQGLYFFWYETTGGTKAGKILDLSPTGSGLTSVDFHASAPATNFADDTLFMVLDDGIIAGGGTTANNELTQWEGASTYRGGSWTSKLYLEAYETAYGIERIRAGDYIGLTTTLSVNDVAMSTLTPLNNVEFTIEQWKGYSHQLTIAWASGAHNPDVETIEFVEHVEELTA